MRIAILTYGSRGDVQPFLALALGLMRAGHEVIVAAPEPYAAFVQGYGVDFLPLAGNPAQLADQLVNVAGTNPFATFRPIAEHVMPIAMEVFRAMRGIVQESDAVVSGLLMTVGVAALAREMGFRDFSAQMFPLFASTGLYPSPVAPPLPLGKAYNRLTHAFFTRMYWHITRLVYGLIARKNPELNLTLHWPFTRDQAVSTPLLFPVSRHVLPAPRDSGLDVQVTGYWFLDANGGWLPPDDLVNFIEAGATPVYIGFGSMAARNSAELTGTVLEALRQSGRRAILATGWGGLKSGDTANRPYDDIFVVDSVPHDWLFPRMAAVVHHGGAGTTAAGLRAGVPSIIIPHTADQPFWGWRVQELGVGPRPIPRQKLSADQLAYALQIATSHAPMRQRAAELGAAIRAEDGIGNAVKIIEQVTIGSIH